jgi:NAD kinase
VVNSHDTVEIRPSVANNCEITVSADGEPRFNMETGSRVTVKRAEREAVIVKTSYADFYDVLKRKIGRFE